MRRKTDTKPRLLSTDVQVRRMGPFFSDVYDNGSREHNQRLWNVRFFHRYRQRSLEFGVPAKNICETMGWAKGIKSQQTYLLFYCLSNLPEHRYGEGSSS